MTSETEPSIESWTGAEAPPRANGELVFEEPWQGRAFGIAAALVDAGHLTWDRFRSELIAQISSWERSQPRADWSYYRCWTAALENLAGEQLGEPTQLEQRARQYAQRPAGHDH